VPRELEPLRLASGQRRHGLPEPQVIEPHCGERLETREYFAVTGEELDRLGNRHLEHVGDAAGAATIAPDAHLEDLGAEPLAIAIGQRR